MAPRSRGLGQRRARSFLCKLQLGPKPDFKFELLPLHSPLLGQSLLVSFPPLIDMLKFSGYSYLIRGQPLEIEGFYGRRRSDYRGEKRITTPRVQTDSATHFRELRRRSLPTLSNEGLRVEMTLEQACPLEY